MLEQQRRSRLNEYRQNQNTVRSMPRLAASSIGEVFQLRLRPDHGLTVDVPEIKTTPRLRHRLDVQELSGPTYIEGYRQVEEVGNFRLQSFDMPHPDTMERIDLRMSSGYFNLTSMVNDGLVMVQLSEQRQIRVEEGGGVRLLIMHRGSDDVVPMNMTFSAADLPTLAREHPDEVEQHLRPLLRRLGQEQIFAPDPDLAWQVLADYWQPKPETAEKVAAALQGLDDPDFRRREKALERLLQLGRDGVLVLRHIDRAGFSPEKHLMVDRAIAPFARVPEHERLRLVGDREFMLDCLSSNDEAVRTVAMKQLVKLTGRSDLKFNPKASAAERYAAARELREELRSRKPGNGEGHPSAPRQFAPSTPSAGFDSMP